MRQRGQGAVCPRALAGVAAASLAVATMVTLAPHAPAAAVTPGEIDTVVGGGAPADGLGDGGPATAAALQAPWGIERVGGRLYVSEYEGGRVRQVDGGRISTYAGGGAAPLGDGRRATEATLSAPSGIAVDRAGNQYIADLAHDRIRRVDARTGIITTVAGTGTAGFSGDGGPATAAQLNHPERVALDAAGNLFISDSDNDRVRRVDARTGRITTVAGTGTNVGSGDGGPATAAGLVPRGIAFDPAGNLYIADVASLTVRRVSAGRDGLVTGGRGEVITTYAGGGTLPIDPANDGKPATTIDVSAPEGLAFDASGNLYIGVVGRSYVVEVAAGGGHPLTTVAGDGNFPPSLHDVGDGGPATSAHLTFPYGVDVDVAGNVYIADLSDARVRRVDATTHVITTFMGDGTPGIGSYGDGGPSTGAEVGEPADVQVRAGSIYIVDRLNNRVRRVDPAGIVTTVAGGGVNDGAVATAAVLDHPRGVLADGRGGLFVADCADARVRRIDGAGVITTVAGGGQDVDGSGRATAAALGCPSGLALATSGPAAGTLYVADAADNVVRKVTPAGAIATVAGTGTAGYSGDGGAATAARLNGPAGVSLTPGGDLLVADTGNNRVRRIDAGSGQVTTVAGDGAFAVGPDGVPATAASLGGPTEAISDRAGGLLIAEASLGRIRHVGPDGRISTVAGFGIPGFGGDGEPARDAVLDLPTNLQLDAGRALLVTDRGNGRVRRIAPGSPPPPPPTGCGSVVAHSTTLSADIGPCPGDGLVVGADGITLDLNGHTVTGSGPGGGNHAGIRLTGRKGVTVSGNAGGGRMGRVTGFSDGIAVIGGSGNTISRVELRDDLGPDSNAVFGDGIGVFLSSANTIVGNVVAHDGIYDGIGLLGLTTDGNVLRDNVVTHTVELGNLNGGTGVGIIVNAFLSEDLPREESITGNAVVGNRVEASDNSGISTISNVNGLIRSNVVRDNGRDPQNAPGNGIGVQHLRNAQIDTSETVADNVVTGNAGAGIFIGAERNTVRRNQVHGNVRSGIVVSEDGHDNRILHNNAAGNVPTGPAFGAGDLVDLSTTPIPTDPFVLYDCDHNTWLGNIWGSGGFFPDPALGPDNPTACTTIGGHAAGGPVASAAAPRGSAAARPRSAAAEAGRRYELQPRSRGGAR